MTDQPAASELYDRIRLITRDGNPVHDSTMPRSRPPADVLVWGTRFFTFDQEMSRSGSYAFTQGDDTHTIVATPNMIYYREASAFYLPDNGAH